MALPQPQIGHIRMCLCPDCGHLLEHPPMRENREVFGHQLVDLTEFPPPWCPRCHAITEPELCEVPEVPF